MSRSTSLGCRGGRSLLDLRGAGGRCSSFLCSWAMVCATSGSSSRNTCLMRDACCLSALLASFRYSARCRQRLLLDLDLLRDFQDLLVQVLDGTWQSAGVWGPVRHVQADGAIGVTMAGAAGRFRARKSPLSTWGGRQAKQLQPIRKPGKGDFPEPLDLEV